VSSERTFRRHLRRRGYASTQETKREPNLLLPVALIPNSKGTPDKVGRIILCHNVKTIFNPPKKIGQALKPVKDQLKMENPVYAVEIARLFTSEMK
jgi:hypothetical protein